MGNIHESAIVDDSVKLGADVTIGPFCCVSGNVTLGDGVTLESHVVVTGNTTIGEATHIYPFASIGHIPQDLKFGNEEVSLEIGARNRIREHVTMNPGTEGGGGLTKVGNDGLFMMGSMWRMTAWSATMSSSPIMPLWAVMSRSVILPFWAAWSACINSAALAHTPFIGAGSLVVEDVIPFGAATGNRAELSGLNLVGLKRRNFDRAEINALRALHKSLFVESEGALMTRLAKAAKEYGDSACVQQVVEFMRVEQNRGYCTPRNK